MAIQYGDEYMDENPITGHPGEFHLSTTGRKNKEKLMVPLPTKSGLQAQGKGTEPPTPEVKNADVNTGRKSTKGDKSPKVAGMPKPKRRKSKAMVNTGGISPT